MWGCSSSSTFHQKTDKLFGWLQMPMLDNKTHVPQLWNKGLPWPPPPRHHPFLQEKLRKTFPPPKTTWSTKRISLPCSYEGPAVAPSTFIPPHIEKLSRLPFTSSFYLSNNWASPLSPNLIQVENPRLLSTSLSTVFPLTYSIKISKDFNSTPNQQLPLCKTIAWS